MITREEAQVLVTQYLISIPKHPETGSCIVRPEQTEEYSGCWVCYWNSKQYIDTGGKGYRLGGNYPIIVDKANGALYLTGFSPVEEYVQSVHDDKAKLKRLTKAIQA